MGKTALPSLKWAPAAPKIQQPGDAVVRVTLSTICTSDLHIMRGAVPRAKSETILGHEFVGVVEETGSEVTSLKPGDRVAANCITFCGECWFCRRGFINNCEKGGWELGCRQPFWACVPHLAENTDCVTRRRRYP